MSTSELQHGDRVEYTGHLEVTGPGNGATGYVLWQEPFNPDIYIIDTHKDRALSDDPVYMGGEPEYDPYVYRLHKNYLTEIKDG